MRLLRTTALTAALMTAAIPLLTSDAQAWRGWRGGGWGWPGAALGAAAVGTALAARSYYGYGYGYPAYGNYDQPRPCLGFFFMAVPFNYCCCASPDACLSVRPSIIGCVHNENFHDRRLPNLQILSARGSTYRGRNRLPLPNSW